MLALVILCATLSDAVYYYRSRLWVCLCVCGNILGRPYYSLRAAFASVQALFINTTISLKLYCASFKDSCQSQDIHHTGIASGQMPKFIRNNQLPSDAAERYHARGTMTQ